MVKKMKVFKVMDEMEWYWEDLWTGNHYWEKDGIIYLVYVENGELKLKEVQGLATKVSENGY